MTLPLVAVPGRRSESAKGLRTPAVAAGARYLDAIARAGAHALVVPPDDDAARVDDVVRRFDAVCLLGGIDVDPARYGQVPHPETGPVDPTLDRFEVAVIEAALRHGRPLLTICRGTQLLNVALGGTLVQHLPDHTALGHRLEYHDVTLEAACRTALLTGSTTVRGHSAHHQAIDRLGAGLVVTGRAPDGVIEAVEMPGRWVVGVQWHPEDSAADDAHQQRLFDGLVAAARTRAQGSE